MVVLKSEMALMLGLRKIPQTMVWRQGSLLQKLKTVLSAWYHISIDLVVATIYANPILSSSTETFNISSRNTLQPHWHHVKAGLEVSISAPCESMIKQILEKMLLMFEAQPFCQFVISLAIWGIFSKKLEFCFLLVNQSGVCVTGWKSCSGYEGISLACIIFALSYAKPELLGIDTSMTIDILSGSVTKIKVQDQEFHVMKHIHSSLILFGHGTHVFLVQTKDGRFHTLKDAWLLVNHGISEITVLSQINDILEKNSSEEAKTYRLMHPQFIVGEEIGDSTKA